MSAATCHHPPVAVPLQVHRARGAVLGLLAGAAVGLALGVAYWAPAAYCLALDDMFADGVLSGFFTALAGIAFYPVVGGTYWAAGGGAAGLVVGLGSDRRAGFTGAVLGMWVGGVAGGLANSDTYASAVAGMLVWAAIGAPVGAAAGHALGPRLAGVPRGAARGLLAGMLVMAAGGVWLLLEVVQEDRRALLSGWCAVPALTGLAGAAVGGRCRQGAINARRRDDT